MADPRAIEDVDSIHQAVVAAVARDIELRILVFVDQLEEVFTQCDDDASRRAFLDKLALAASKPDIL